MEGVCPAVQHVLYSEYYQTIFHTVHQVLHLMLKDLVLRMLPQTRCLYLVEFLEGN